MSEREQEIITVELLLAMKPVYMRAYKRSDFILELPIDQLTIEQRAKIPRDVLKYYFAHVTVGENEDILDAADQAHAIQVHQDRKTRRRERKKIRKERKAKSFRGRRNRKK